MLNTTTPASQSSSKWFILPIAYRRSKNTASNILTWSLWWTKCLVKAPASRTWRPSLKMMWSGTYGIGGMASDGARSSKHIWTTSLMIKPGESQSIWRRQTLISLGDINPNLSRNSSGSGKSREGENLPKCILWSQTPCLNLCYDVIERLFLYKIWPF